MEFERKKMCVCFIFLIIFFCTNLNIEEWGGGSGRGGGGRGWGEGGGGGGGRRDGQRGGGGGRSPPPHCHPYIYILYKSLLNDLPFSPYSISLYLYKLYSVNMGELKDSYTFSSRLLSNQKFLIIHVNVSNNGRIFPLTIAS